MELPHLLPVASQLSAFTLDDRDRPNPWCYAELVGNLCELSGQGASATMTVAMALVVEAQRAGEPCAWICHRQACFFPPDAVTHGVDFASLAVVRVPQHEDIGRAADMLVRSGAFGLLVLDLGAESRVPDRQLTRLLGLARKHGAAIVCLTAKPDSQASLGSVIALRGSVKRERIAPGQFACELQAVKDKRRAPGWRQREVYRGPAGLR